MANEQRAVVGDSPAVSPVPLLHLWIRNILNVLACIIKLLQTIGITDKERAFTIIEDAAWTRKLAVARTFFPPLLNEFSRLIEVLDSLTFVGDGIFDREDMIIFGDGHATNIVELACATDAIAAPLI